MTDNNILAICGLGLQIRGLKILDNLGFQIKQGEILSVIGPNGAGKTSLINCITGYYQPQFGTIGYDGKNITGMKPHQIARLRLSRTFQNPTTFPTLTTLDILLSARYLKGKVTLPESLWFFGRSRSEERKSRAEVEEIISFSRIEELRKRPLNTMSYGQRKQVEIARALVLNPKLLLLDEPMSGLDEVMKEIVTELILNVHKKGMTILLIEHDMRTVMGLSQTVVVLEHGKKIMQGTPTEVTRDNRVAAAYLGTTGAGN
jgi:branched-chain amino acid transport system ATP-binding protein